MFISVYYDHWFANKFWVDSAGSQYLNLMFWAEPQKLGRWWWEETQTRLYKKWIYWADTHATS